MKNDSHTSLLIGIILSAFSMQLWANQPDPNDILNQVDALMKNGPAQMVPNMDEISNVRNSVKATTDFVNTIKMQPAGKTPFESPQKAQSPKAGYDLLLFVSASMPEAEIKNYSKQAKSFGATLVLRGFVNDRQSETRQFIAALNEGGAQWMIHPASYQMFKVEKVPTIVLAKGETGALTDEGCAQETVYTKVSGDITIDAALDLFSRRSEPEFAAASKTLIQANLNQYKQGKIVR